LDTGCLSLLMFADSFSTTRDTVVRILTMFTLRTHSFGFRFCHGCHCDKFGWFGKRACLSILRGDVRQRHSFRKVSSTAQDQKSKKRAVGQNYFVF
jgi:hypothetical protein